MPTPEPTVSADPFNPDVEIWPEPPSWLFPGIMGLLAFAGMVLVVLLFMWRKSIKVQAEEREKHVQKSDWVDLSQLGKKGRWADEESTDPHTREDRGRTKRDED